MQPAPAKKQKNTAYYRIREQVATTPTLSTAVRDTFQLREVAVYLKERYAITISYTTVYRWITCGRPLRDQRGIPKDNKRMAVLKTFQFAGRRFVKRADVDEFLSLT